MLFLANGEAEYFCKWGWTGKITSTPLICPSGKSQSCQRPITLRPRLSYNLKRTCHSQ